MNKVEEEEGQQVFIPFKGRFFADVDFSKVPNY